MKKFCVKRGSTTLFAAAAVFSADEATDAARNNDGAYYLQTQIRMLIK